MPPALTPEESEIRARLESLASAIRREDVDAVMAHYAPDIVVYDVNPPLTVQSLPDYRANMQRWFASMPGRLDYDMEDVRVSMSDSHAFCHYVGRVRGTRKSGERADYRVRVTTCLQKVNGQWLVAHEHVSVPAGA